MKKQPPPGASAEALQDLSRKLVDEGFLIEAGWLALRAISIPVASAIQIDQMRMAYFAGAQHLFSSIMTIMDEDAEPTAKDLQRMEKIHLELEDYATEMRRRLGQPEPPRH